MSVRPRTPRTTPLNRRGSGDGARAPMVRQVTSTRTPSLFSEMSNLEAVHWFPEGTYPPALPFIGPKAPRRPPSPPTRRITVLESGDIERGEIPVVGISAMAGSAGSATEDIAPDKTEPRARGQPP